MPARHITGALRQRTLLLGLLALAAPTAVRADDAAGLRAAQRHQQALFERVAPSVVYLSRGSSFGSGFFVNHSGLVLTNAHVVGNASSVDVVLSSGQKAKAQVVKRAPDKVDLALVQTPFRQTPALPLDPGSLRVGSWVAAVGHGEGGIWTFTTGMVSNIYPTKEGRDVFQTQIPLNPGASGGPIVDLDGRVLGVVTAGIKGSNNINFAINAAVIGRAFPELAPRQACTDCLTIQAPSGTAIFLDGRHVGQGPLVRVPASKGKHEVMAVIAGAMVKRSITWPQDRSVQLRR